MKVPDHVGPCSSVKEFLLNLRAMGRIFSKGTCLEKKTVSLVSMWCNSRVWVKGRKMRKPYQKFGWAVMVNLAVKCHREWWEVHRF